MSWQIKKQDIPFLAMGAKLIGCGGGGNPVTIQNLLMTMMKDEEFITIKTLADLKNEWIVGTGMMGSTVFYNEDLPSGLEGSQVLTMYESIVDQKAGAIIPVEIGGINGLDPLLTAYLNRLPVVDGDGMGRAFPELWMTTFHLNEIPITPLVLLSNEEHYVVQGYADIRISSEKAKEFIAKSGGYVHFAGFGASAKKMRSAMIPGTLRLIYLLGRTLLKETTVEIKMEEMMAVFENSLYGKPIEIISGVVTVSSRWFEDGALIGKFKVEGRSTYSNKSVEIVFRNEFIAIKEKQYICTSPDLIMVLDEEKLIPYRVSDIQEGLSVTILAVPAPNILRTREMIEFVGPKNFDIPGPYQPLEGDSQDEIRN